MFGLSIQTKRIRDADWKTITPKLMLYAEIIYTRKLERLAGAPLPEDLVQEAVLSLCESRRKIPADVELLFGMQRIIDSLVSNAISKGTVTDVDHKARKGRRIPFDLNQEFSHKAFAPTQIDRISYLEVLKLIEGDGTCQQIVELWRKDPVLPPRDISVILRIPLFEIRNSIKRLRRKMREYREIQEVQS